MFLNKIIGSLFILSFCQLSYSSWNGADKALVKRMDYKQKLRSLSMNLISDKKYFTSIPWVKEYLIRGNRRLDTSFEKSFSDLIDVVGIKQFETLPLKFLRRSKSPSIKYIIAKKLTKRKSYKKALSSLSNISSRHAIYPYAKNLEGTIYSLIKDSTRSVLAFSRCVNSSQSLISNSKNPNRLKLNRDYCTAGLARANFNAKKYSKSDLLYLDISKSSRVWPEILFEEAWNSYYLKNYNRSLGKLVSYNAPVFDHIFNPEIEVLQALSYMKLCQYEDAKRVTDSFYKKYLKDARKLRTYIRRNQRDLNFFYKLMINYENSKSSFFPLLTRLLKSTSKDQVFVDFKKSLGLAIKEYNVVKTKRNSRLKKAAISNLEDVIIGLKKMIGGYIKSRLTSSYASLYQAFEGMSFIKLETLAEVKAKLYSFEKNGDKRGDVKYIKRNDKQYFWNFNGEFWADELGDYVFALKSEC